MSPGPDRALPGGVRVALRIALAALLLPSSALAVEGPVVEVLGGGDLVVDLLAASEGQLLEVLRPIEVRHPVTGERIADRFRIGGARIVRTGARLSVARLLQPAQEPVRAGDVVRSVDPAAPAAPPIVSAAAPVVPPGPVEIRRASGVAERAASIPDFLALEPLHDPDTEDLLIAWHATLTKPVHERIATYEQFLDAHPASRYAEAIRMELASLHAETEPPPPSAEAVHAIRLQRAVRGANLGHVRRGHPAEVSAVVTRGAPIRSLQLHARPVGANEWTTVPMPLDSRLHARAPVPASSVGGDGLEYYVEVIDDAGTSVPVAGHPQAPRRAETLAPHRVDRSDRSRVRLSSEYVSYDRLAGDDWHSLTEADFLYRMRVPVLHGIRIGYGVLRGEGGTVEDLDVRGLPPRPVGFTYGYTELDLEPVDSFAILPRVELGLVRPEDARDERHGLRPGFQGRIRLGRGDGTNFVLAGETVPDLGQRAFVALAWRRFETFPMTGEVHVTDQPVDAEELAVRLVYELGVRPSDVFAVAARVSYQGRTIDHSGFGGGLAATFDW